MWSWARSRRSSRYRRYWWTPRTHGYRWHILYFILTIIPIAGPSSWSSFIAIHGLSSVHFPVGTRCFVPYRVYDIFICKSWRPQGSPLLYTVLSLHRPIRPHPCYAIWLFWFRFAFRHQHSMFLVYGIGAVIVKLSLNFDNLKVRTVLSLSP